jgi:hypothetical protein
VIFESLSLGFSHFGISVELKAPLTRGYVVGQVKGGQEVMGGVGGESGEGLGCQGGGGRRGDKVSRPTKLNPLAPEKPPHTLCVIPQL